MQHARGLRLQFEWLPRYRRKQDAIQPKAIGGSPSDCKVTAMRRIERSAEKRDAPLRSRVH
jgi:hypothetical protein